MGFLSLKNIGTATTALCCIAIVSGFGVAGIAAGSLASFIQSSIGNVAAGSSFSILQSLGMKGAYVGGVKYGLVTATTGWIYEKLFKSKETPKETFFQSGKESLKASSGWVYDKVSISKENQKKHFETLTNAASSGAKIAGSALSGASSLIKLAKGSK